MICKDKLRSLIDNAYYNVYFVFLIFQWIILMDNINHEKVRIPRVRNRKNKLYHIIIQMYNNKYDPF